MQNTLSSKDLPTPVPSRCLILLMKVSNLLASQCFIRKLRITQSPHDPKWLNISKWECIWRSILNCKQSCTSRIISLTTLNVEVTIRSSLNLHVKALAHMKRKPEFPCSTWKSSRNYGRTQWLSKDFPNQELWNFRNAIRWPREEPLWQGECGHWRHWQCHLWFHFLSQSWPASLQPSSAKISSQHSNANSTRQMDAGLATPTPATPQAGKELDHEKRRAYGCPRWRLQWEAPGCLLAM